MSQISAWASSAREKMREYLSNDQNMNEDLQAVGVIGNFLTGGQSTLRAAHRIACIYEPRLKTSHRSDIAILWRIICQAARSIDSSASVRLAQLVLSLRAQPDIISSTGDVVKHENLVYWRDLPRWDQMFREHGYEIDPSDGNDVDWHAQAPQLLNITVFAATLMARSDGTFDVLFPASIAMELGVDRPYDNTRELGEEWRMYIPPAATWILIAGSKIRELCYTEELPEAANQHSIRSQWGGRTYCSRRWEFWKQRFQQLAEDTAIDDRCQEYAKQAFGAMDKLDAEN
ncbi:hypothetical protein KCU65_g7369, partial [Aureobasidium melanogenum]